MSTELRIWKAKLRTRYLAYKAEGADYGCGATLTDYITGGRLTRLKESVNEAVRKCRELDPSCTIKEIS